MVDKEAIQQGCSNVRDEEWWFRDGYMSPRATVSTAEQGAWMGQGGHLQQFIASRFMVWAMKNNVKVWLLHINVMKKEKGEIIYKRSFYQIVLWYD